MHSGLKKYGLTVAASRKTTGNHSLHEKLEEVLQGLGNVEVIQVER